jgi:hypothetical protein
MMAEYNSAEIVAQTGAAKELAHYSSSASGVATIPFSFTVPASGFVAGDTIVLGNVPKDARILPQSRIVWQALGGSTTLTVGHKGYTQPDGTVVSAGPAVFLASTSAVSAGGANFDVASRFAVGPIRNAAKTTPIVATVGASNATPGAIISGNLIYTVPSS